MIQPKALLVANRVAAALIGGYAFTFGFVALGIAILVAFGVDFHVAEEGMLMLSFLVFLSIFLWAFAVKRVSLVWGLFIGGAGITTGSAWALQAIVLAGS